MLRKDRCEMAEGLLKYLVDEDRLCGYNFAVVTPDEEYVSSYGYRQKVGELLKADRNTIYDVASLSKVVSTTTCILKLLEAKEISLDDTIHSLIPRFADESVTVLECLTHSSGLRDIDDYKKLSDEQFIDAIYNARPLEEGKGIIFYADINFILLGFLIAKLKGSLDGYASEAVFKPLGMKHTCYNP
ncbi:MAG: beta-lactamase family protein, partial [Erysipelotrichaceae bacterium]|nr:beta-lactamase family protein [Erysipelotrichaceae bacterium]